MEIREVQRPLEPFNLLAWIEKNKHPLIPPVANETIYKGNDNFIVMVSGGPNSRKDYHYNESEELFFQLKGDVKVRLFVDGQHKEVDLREGDMLLIPPKVPHSPQRFANTIGLIINLPGSLPQGLTESDGFQIRRLAIDHHIPLITNVKIAELMLRCLIELDGKKPKIKSWNEYLAVL